MKTLFTTSLLAFFISAIAQDYIRNDFSLGVSSGIPYADLVFSPGGEAILNRNFYIIPLSPDFLPVGEAIELSPSNFNNSFQGCSYFAGNELAMLWYTGKTVGSQYISYLKMQLFDTLGNNLSPEITVDSTARGYSGARFIAGSPDQDNEIGIAWASDDTLYAVYFNLAGKVLSADHILLTGSGPDNIQVVDFMQNGNVRIIWRDMDNNVRHKKLTKTGDILNDESILFGPGEVSYGSRILKYSSVSNGDFLLAEFHKNPINYEYGIETRKFNTNGVSTSNALWVCDSICVSMQDDWTKYYQVSMQEDGKAVVVWNPFNFDYTLHKDVRFIYMQFLDVSGNKFGDTFKPVTINTESYNKSYGVREQYPFVLLSNDTVILLWNNYNEEISSTPSLYMNVQRFTMPVVSSLSTISRSELNHWITLSQHSGELILAIESPVNCKATVEIIDLLGRPVGSTGKVTIQSGLNNVLLHEQGIALQEYKGILLYRINIDGNIYQGKFLKQNLQH
ncbi:MAG: hypothetical protein JXB00_18055 [Bacteroidales bacterium]|nr:hypothetical protein [Bacteroidales bacterium]